MTYWVKEDAVLREPAPGARLEVYTPRHGWQPYPYRRQDIEFYRLQQVSPERAQQELQANGVTAAAAARAVRGA